MNKIIKKCRFCSEPYNGWISETDDGVCPECHKKADAKDR